MDRRTFVGNGLAMVGGVGLAAVRSLKDTAVQTFSLARESHVAEVPPLGLTPDVMLKAGSELVVSIAFEPAIHRAPVMVDKVESHFVNAILVAINETGVPVWEDPPLAKALFRTCSPGLEISPVHYAPVAEVLAYLYRLHHVDGPEMAELAATDDRIPRWIRYHRERELYMGPCHTCRRAEYWRRLEDGI